METYCDVLFSCYGAHGILAEQLFNVLINVNNWGNQYIPLNIFSGTHVYPDLQSSGRNFF